ncbi:dTDP-4-dehydrorhamnose reductase [Oceanisphaera sp. IT1-181]|uniref:dTDP-4-dehydrorhamnose reductase n=1 Tax=Oceanisphaera sp. IT1-181 TaxID=3081199 RepID=UPI0029CA8A99|nr:dTDP-4-dehydrorhamnose reductase [Oceanisphaera sp. IT1-181]
MRILLLGKNGQVGWELQRALAPLGTVTALDRHSTEFCGDLTKPEELVQTIRALKPDVIVNAAAYTAVDKAESEPMLARQINADTLAVLATEANKLGAWLVHYSTDYVFNGEGDTPWREDDITAPLNVYGSTKLAGENIIAHNCKRHLIFRTSWVYAARGNNFAKTMLRLAKEREELGVINDQIGAPTGADLIADCTAHAIRTVMGVSSLAGSQQTPSLAGIYHLAASGETTWLAYAEQVFAHARAQGLELKLSTLNAIATADYATPAQRPLNSRLNTKKLSTAFGLTLPPWQQGVTRMLTEILEKN